MRCPAKWALFKDDIKISAFHLEIDEEDNDSEVDEGVGRGDQVRLLVNHKDQGGKQARLRRTEHTTEFFYI